MRLLSIVPKFGLSGAKEKLTLLFLVLTMLVFACFGCQSDEETVASAEKCITCHSMNPEYQTWAASSHSNIDCSSCHEGENGGSENASGPVQLANKVQDELCEKCHSIENRVFTVSGDIIIPHQRHMKSEVVNVDCVDCHFGVVHGKIAGRGMNAPDNKKAPHEGDLTAWTIEDGRAQTVKEYVKADMDDCIACHAKNNQTIRCEACHKTIFTPDNHSPEDSWLPIHGKDARADVGYCKTCHTYGMKVQKVDIEDKAAAYAWGNEYCIGCHKQMPASHERSTWRKDHKLDVQDKGKGNCAACHNFDDKEAVKGPAQLACTRCH